MERMKKLWSVFTEDMDHCFFTDSAPVERHHIFGGANKKLSEKYGYIIPLTPTLHPNGVFAGKDAHRMDINLKQMAQKHYEENHGARSDFIREFGKSWL